MTRTVSEVPKEIEVTLGKGVSGTLAFPINHDHENPVNNGHAPPCNKVALLLHGQAGHRNYCYQRILAHRLAADLGMYSLRIDFRGCGNSAENENSEEGRVLSQDTEDIQDCVEFLSDPNKHGLGINFTLSSIISHSRGSVAMFLWAMEQDRLEKSGKKSFKVPVLINASSRYRSETVLLRYPIDQPEMWSMPQMALRYNKYQTVPIPMPEIKSLARADLSDLPNLSPDVSVLNIYGMKDEIIPPDDGSLFTNALSRGKGTVELRLIPLADHNFYGVNPVHNESDADEFNPTGLPLNSKKLVNYNYLATDIIVDYLGPKKSIERFFYKAETIARVSRWKDIEGVANFRDTGGWKIANSKFEPQSSRIYVRPGLLYRCANMTNITENGLKQLQRMGIDTIFDLRSSKETMKYGYPKDLEKYGISRLHTPVFREDDFSPQNLFLRRTALITSWHTYVTVYESILDQGVEAFRAIFEHILKTNKPFIFHCTAGKDRTGVLAMLILLLLGVDRDTISMEYELTAIGLKPDHEEMQKEFLKNVEKMKSNLPDTWFDEVSKGREGWTIEKDGFANLISSRNEAMLATLDLVNDKYGGIFNYMKNYLKFTDLEIEQIHNKLTTKDAGGIQWEFIDTAVYRQTKM